MKVVIDNKQFNTVSSVELLGIEIDYKLFRATTSH